MNTISKQLIFYITIFEKDNTDHSYLRQVIHKVLPHAIVESVSGGEEALHYVNNIPTKPHLIFLDENMKQISGKDTVEIIHQVDLLSETPIIFLTNTPQKSQSTSHINKHVGHFYSKPYQQNDLRELLGDLNSKWLA